MPVIGFTISGTVSGAIADGVIITLSETGGGTPSTVTAGGGLYSFSSVSAGAFPLTITPSLVGYTFSPPSIMQTTASSYSGQDFTASSSATNYGQQVGAFLVGI
jgi:hypothetical protein